MHCISLPQWIIFGIGKREYHVDKKEFIEQVEAQLRILDKEIQLLAAKAEKAGLDLKADLQAQVNALVSKSKNTEKLLRELREKGEGAWGEAREGMEKAWGDLRQSLEKAAERFK